VNRVGGNLALDPKTEAGTALVSFSARDQTPAGTNPFPRVWSVESGQKTART
jgi:hypothetical protein